MLNAMNNWCAQERAKGLVGLHLTIRPGSSASAEDVCREFLACEAAIQAGSLRPAPKPVTQIPPEIARFIATH